MYSSGNIDVRNWVHLFESPCILSSTLSIPDLGCSQLPIQCVNVMVKQSLYRPGKDLRVQGCWVPRSRDNRHTEARSPTHRPPLPSPQKLFLVLISVRDRVNPTAIVRPEGLCQWKIPMTPSGIESATFRLVAQSSNCSTACPNRWVPELFQESKAAVTWNQPHTSIYSWG